MNTKTEDVVTFPAETTIEVLKLLWILRDPRVEVTLRISNIREHTFDANDKHKVAIALGVIGSASGLSPEQFEAILQSDDMKHFGKGKH